MFEFGMISYKEEYLRAMDLPETMPSLSELRNLTERFLLLSKREADPQLKRGLAGSAFAISQLAECIEVRAAKIGDRAPSIECLASTKVERLRLMRGI